MYFAGIDVGGTFTDLVLINEEDNTIQEAKAATTPENQLYGIANALKKIASFNNMGVEDFIPMISNFIHGTIKGCIGGTINMKPIPYFQWF